VLLCRRPVFLTAERVGRYRQSRECAARITEAYARLYSLAKPSADSVANKVLGHVDSLVCAYDT
jgi:hypothetical protein